MSRTRRAWAAAAGLMALSAAVTTARHYTGGEDAGVPPGASSWEVTITARGELPGKGGQVVVAAPPDFRRQHVFDEGWKADGLTRREGRGNGSTRTDSGREAAWKPAAAAGDPYRVTYTFRCVLGIRRPTAGMGERTKALDGPPAPETDGTLRAAPRVESDAREVGDLARDLAGDEIAAADQVRAYFDHVSALPFEVTGGNGGALDALRSGGGDAAGKARLLVALCRARGVPARAVTGLVLNPNAEPSPHVWAEAWVRGVDGPEGHWLPLDPTYEHFGARRWPTNYLVLRLDDDPPVRAGDGGPKAVGYFARELKDATPTVLSAPQDGPPAPTDWRTRATAAWRAASFATLSPGEQQLARFLLLLPVAAVVVCVFRVVIGVPTFGIFSPALLGLIFRDLSALPWGLGIFFATVLVGWGFRKVLDRYHLLLIPRTAALLTLLVGFLLLVILVASGSGVTITGYVALFPLIILTHMVERFWTVEAEDGVRSSLKTLLGTVVVATAVAFAVAPDAVGRWLFRRPETLFAVVGVQLLLGRYTGYRVSELYRFRDVIILMGNSERGIRNAESEEKTKTAAMPTPGPIGDHRPPATGHPPPVPAAGRPWSPGGTAGGRSSGPASWG